jgi:hypothetical protein
MPESISMEDLSVLYDNIMGDKGPEYRSIDEVNNTLLKTSVEYNI